MDNGKSKFITKKIKVYGIVQGVGFRPLVYRIARMSGITGTVCNVGGYVEIIAQARQQALDNFIRQLRDNRSGGCEIIKLMQETIMSPRLTDFIIIDSKVSEEISVIPPDLPVCPDCQRELYDKNDRRWHNPFISCMSCGPRYTIIEELPYDRNHTTMVDFHMCPSCHGEYTSPDSRRFHAQTISCNDCGPYLIFHEKLKTGMSDRELINEEAFEQAVQLLQAGGIIAVKGIGGYHLVCSPYMEETVVKLRKLKGREEKPFAVMFPSLTNLKKVCRVSAEEDRLLNSNARPIVLLYMRQDDMAPSVNRGSICCGAFLPYTPLQLMLTRRLGPLIMTSANRSDQPIIREDEEILTLNSPYLDGVLYNKRRIVRSVDDSVAKVIDGKPQLIRRSRGYVPYPVFLHPRKEQIEQLSSEGKVLEDRTESNSLACDRQFYTAINPEVMAAAINSEKKAAAINSEKMALSRENALKEKETINSENIEIFAAGGDLKAAFCLYRNGKAVVSQYFGDLEEVHTYKNYKESFTDLSRLFMMRPALAVCDLHPNYHSAQFADTLKIPVLRVQHHHAHIASVMAEHDLTGRVIGVAFDGTGYGTDGNIWGGEFLICEGAEFIRAAQLSYMPILGGDQSMKDAKKTATCYLLNTGLDAFIEDDRKNIIKSALEHKVNTVLTSSMGRLFDAVSSILNISQENRYEGECAAALERKAVLAVRNHIDPVKLDFAIRENGAIIELDQEPVLNTLCSLRESRSAGALALSFHYALARAVSELCVRLRDRYDSNIVALGGGVFQNTVLTEQTLELLRQNNFEVYINQAVPPNDGGISLGQTYIGLMRVN